MLKHCRGGSRGLRPFRRGRGHGRRGHGRRSRQRKCECACARLRICVVEARFLFEMFQGYSIDKIVLRTVVQKRWRSAAKAQTLCFASSGGSIQLKTLRAPS